MNSSKNDYLKLYALQDKFLVWWVTLGLPFYLTGGTALGRFYLNHRYSEDLDFFSNADPSYLQHITSLKSSLPDHFKVDLQNSLFTEDFTRFFIIEEDVFLKIELVNDVKYYKGTPGQFKFGLIDSPENILANKLTAIVGRDEPKDIFDIVCISQNYSFDWREIFKISKEKTVINEIDVAERLFSFPAELLTNLNWISNPVDLTLLKKYLTKIADDFLLGNTNSLGLNKAGINRARIITDIL